jgi:hypothetical protein
MANVSMEQHTAAEGVDLGLSLLALTGIMGPSTGRICIEWPRNHHVWMRILKKFGNPIDPNLEVDLSYEEGKGMFYLKRDEIQKIMMMTTEREQERPVVLYNYRRGMSKALYIPMSKVIDADTNFIGANCMRTNGRPPTAEVRSKYVYLKNEVVDGRTPRAYHVDGLKRWWNAGGRTNPVTRAQFRPSNLRMISSDAPLQSPR